MNKKYILAFVLFLSLGLGVFAQTLPVGSAAEDRYRLKQLMGEVPLSSFSVRPIVTHALDAEDSVMRVNGYTPRIQPITFAKGLGEFKLLPVTWDQQFNSDHPYGWNDGSMIPAKGYQTRLSAGFFAKIWHLSIQFQPELVYAANSAFRGFATGKNDTELAQYYGYYNLIDAPERFGNNAYSKAFLGQSSIRLNFEPVSIGASNENLWWGPGRQNALLMTNNAPGFTHFTMNTTRPIHTPIGAFEGQLIGGWLEGSNAPPLLQTTTSTGAALFLPFNTDSRYLSGMNLNYQPKWIPGLTLGFNRTFMSYSAELKGFSDYFPLFVKLQKKGGDQDAYPRDQRISLYTRWLFPEAHAEVYFEYGLNDNAFNFRDFITSPDHARSYLFGFSKIVPLNRKDEVIQVNAEITQLSQSIDRTVRPSGGFYQHSGVYQGHTNLGQVLGAGTGNGGNLQGLLVDWVKGYRKVGLSIQRFEHEMDFYNDYIKDLNGLSRKWVDFAVGVNGQWELKNLLVRAKLQGIQSLNYQWLLKDYTPGTYYVPHNDVFNFHGELGVSYRF